MANNDHNDERLHRLRHSAAHVMAQAVLEKFPEGKVAIGPPIDDGFYYDFDLPRALTPDDLGEIESRVREIVSERIDFEYLRTKRENSSPINRTNLSSSMGFSRLERMNMATR